MSTFYIDLLSIFFLFLTALTCFFALFKKGGIYWFLPFLAASILCGLRILKLIDPEYLPAILAGRKLYIEMMTPTALLLLFLSSLFLRYGIRNRPSSRKTERQSSSHHLSSFDDDHIALDHGQPHKEKPVPTPAVPARRTAEPAASPTMIFEPDEQEPDVNPDEYIEEVPYEPYEASPDDSVETRQLELFFDRLAEVTGTQTIRHDEGYIYITGIKHSGKTTKGRMAANMLDCDFHDLDELILDLCEFSPLSDLSIREIYSAVGKERFMLLEYATMHQFIFMHQQEPNENSSIHLIALGGGACDNATLMELLQWTGSIIYIAAEEAVLYSRIIKNGIPPFLDASDPRKSFHTLFVNRDAAYREAAGYVITSSPEAPVEEGANSLYETIGSIRGGTDEQ